MSLGVLGGPFAFPWGTRSHLILLSEKSRQKGREFFLVILIFRFVSNECDGVGNGIFCGF